MRIKHFIKYESPLGNLIIESNGEELTGLSFAEGGSCSGDGRGSSSPKEERACIEEKDAVLRETCDWLDSYFNGEIPGFMPPIHFEGTEFQKDVWNILLEIPYGETMSYAYIAKRMAEKRGIKRMSAQAVGGAVGRNNIAIIVPCHRVIGSDGSLTGYAGGLEKKIRLLTLEKAEFREQ